MTHLAHPMHVVPERQECVVFDGRKRVSLTAGKHVLKIVADRQYFNLNAVRVR